MAKCRKCRKEVSTMSINKEVRRSPDGRRINRRKEQRAAKMRRLMKEANHLAVELGSSETVGESVVSAEKLDSHPVAHGQEGYLGEGAILPVPSSQVVEDSSENHSITGMARPEIGEGLESEPVQEERPLERPIVSEWNESLSEGQF